MSKERQLQGYDYTNEELAEKRLAVTQMLRDHPNVPGGVIWIEWLYDYIKKELGEEEFKKRMNSGYYE